MNIIYYIIHSFTGCPEDNLEYLNKGRRAVCKKCGRTHFVFNTYN